ncbi:TcaA 3rd/4th domain-containing protein [Clostridium fallax]|uniref:TcaA 4th domain-containing protein n=1 Tax=Clostridium fallax TaxID=1533 RepID=A0A1M4Y9Z3_9CLOT|nr:hypothetical protein [Clostridium fallax]SHF02564.1 hypothetical protein SAMN05443638_12531 [Clostridium fallax]SQB06043.1 membrane-associated protein [Clostridium fallax]
MKETCLKYFHNLIDYLKGLDKRIYVIIGIIVCITIGFYFGYIKNSKNYFFKDLEKSIKKKNYGSLEDLITLDNKKIKEKNDLKPFVDYFENNESIFSFISTLKKGGKWGENIAEIKSKKSFLGTRYYLNLEPRNLSIKGNFKDIKLYLDGKSIGVLENIDEPINVDNLIPGKYTIKGELNNKDFSFDKEETFTLMDKNLDYYFQLDGIKVSLDTPYENAEVLINGKDSEIRAKDFKDIGPFPMDGSFKLSLKYDFPWGTITSNEVPIEELPIIKIPFNIVNDTLENQVDDSVKEFYNSVIDSLNKESKELITGCSEDVKNEIYSILKEQYFLLKNNYTVTDVKVNFSQSQFKFEDNKYKGNLVVDVGYTIDKKIFGIQIKESKYTKNFFTNIVYHNGKWIVTDVQNFTLTK